MYHPRCTFCRSLKTIKWGSKRYRCSRCARTFRLKRSDIRDRAAIDAYVKDRSTFRRLGARWKVNASTAYRRVKRALERKQTLIERTKKYLAKCDGVLVLDGKHLRIFGKRFTLFVAWDRSLGLPVHFLLKDGGEKELWYWKLILDLRNIGYAPKAFVSDGIPTLAEFLADAYEGLPHQRCSVHVFLRARSMAAARGVMTSEQKERSSDFIELVRHILWSKSIDLARRRLDLTASLHPLLATERRALRHVEEALPACFVATQSKWKHLRLPRSSNAIENVIGQVEARLKTRRGTKSIASLDALVNELLLEVKQQVTNR